MKSPEQLARAWLEAFNAHDVAGVVALYAEVCTHTSPKLRALHPETGGKLHGKAALTRWWSEAMVRLPGIRYEATAVTADSKQVVIEYLRHAPNEPVMPVAEAFEVHDGQIVASRVYHG